MFTLLALGSIGFWVLLALESIILLALIENERPWLGGFTLIVTGVLLHFFGGVNLLSLVLANPGLSALCLVGYLAVGVAWALVKWFLFALRKKEEYLEAKESWKPEQEARWDYVRDESNRILPDKAQVKSGPTKWEDSHARKLLLNSKGGLMPLARENKERIMLWIAYWPWSLLWTLVDDPLKRLARHIFNMIQDTLQSISNRVFKGVE